MLIDILTYGRLAIYKYREQNKGLFDQYTFLKKMICIYNLSGLQKQTLKLIAIYFACYFIL